MKLHSTPWPIPGRGPRITGRGRVKWAANRAASGRLRLHASTGGGRFLWPPLRTRPAAPQGGYPRWMRPAGTPSGFVVLCLWVGRFLIGEGWRPFFVGEVRAFARALSPVCSRWRPLGRWRPSWLECLLCFATLWGSRRRCARGWGCLRSARAAPRRARFPAWGGGPSWRVRAGCGEGSARGPAGDPRPSVPFAFSASRPVGSE